MKWNDLFFNVDFGKCIQKGVDEFARLSGYKIQQKKPLEKNKITKRNGSMYILFLYLLIILLFAASFASCKKSNISSTNPPPPASKDTTVYVAGTENDRAVYWKNGTAVALTNGQYGSNATSVFVSGNDVYICGFEFDGKRARAGYWKNGTAFFLEDGSTNPYSSYATAITVADNHIYIAGFESNTGGIDGAIYWKDGKAVNLNSGTNQSRAHSIFVLDNDVYVSGWEANTSKFSVAKYWKNGQGVVVSDAKTRNAIAYAISVANNNIYTAGFTYNAAAQGVQDAAMYSKNGIVTPLADGKYQSNVYSMVVSGNDVHMVGYEVNTTTNGAAVKYWKNGSSVSIDDGFKVGIGYSVFLSGSDVYIAGYENDGRISTAKYWKNGKAILLKGTTEVPGQKLNMIANAIYVK
jgi:hypothetical protein